MILVLAFRLGLAAECHGQPGAVHPNNSPIDSNLPRFVKRVPNGKLFLVGSDEMNTTTKLIHVYGTMYEMGYAQGQLLTA
jgi:isopenicillin-N N-acyltransferase like protein